MQLIAGLVMALAAILLVLEPLLRAASGLSVEAPLPLFADSDDDADPRFARRDRALAALKEIDFDRATGKLSEDDYGKLKAEFTEEALAALREADAAAEAPPAAVAPSAISHLPAAAPDEVEKLIASARKGGNGGRKSRRFCYECGAALQGSRRFCTDCGAVLKVS